MGFVESSDLKKILTAHKINVLRGSGTVLLRQTEVWRNKTSGSDATGQSLDFSLEDESVQQQAHALAYAGKDAYKRKLLLMEERVGGEAADYYIRILQSSQMIRQAVVINKLLIREGPDMLRSFASCLKPLSSPEDLEPPAPINSLYGSSTAWAVVSSTWSIW